MREVHALCVSRFVLISVLGIGEYLVDLISIMTETVSRFFYTLIIKKVCPRLTLNNMQEEFHLGHLIQEELKRQKRTKTWLAETINCDRSNCYDIFKRKFINVELLEKISIALGRNFFNDLAEYEGNVVKNSI